MRIVPSRPTATLSLSALSWINLQYVLLSSSHHNEYNDFVITFLPFILILMVITLLITNQVDAVVTMLPFAAPLAHILDAPLIQFSPTGFLTCHHHHHAELGDMGGGAIHLAFSHSWS